MTRQSVCRSAEPVERIRSTGDAQADTPQVTAMRCCAGLKLWLPPLAADRLGAAWLTCRQAAGVGRSRGTRRSSDPIFKVVWFRSRLRSNASV